MFKKGDPKLLENYRPITILPILYKVFSRVLNERLKSILKRAQSVAGFSCDDHLFTVAMLHEKMAEWKQELWIVAIDFKNC